VVLTVDAYTAPLAPTVYINAASRPLHCRVIAALRRVTVTLTGFADVVDVTGSRSPGLLLEPRAALLTLLAASVVFTAADELLSVERIGLLTLRRVTVADTPASDRDVLYTVVVPSGNSRITARDGHEVTEEGLGSQQT
jgi:hypothetical protein